MKKISIIAVALFSTIAPINFAFGAGGDAPATEAPAAAPKAQMSAAEIQALADAGNFADAEKNAKAALEKEKSAELYNLLGFSQRKQNKWDDSIKSYKEALKLKPDFPQAKEYLAVAYLNKGKKADAKKLHTELKKSHPDLAKMIEDEAMRLKIKL